MLYRLVIYSVVYDEIVEAIDYYESIYQELGQKFEVALQQALDKLENNPFHYFNLEDNLHRRIVLEDFPYALIYSVHEEEVKVKMLFSQLQNPARMWERLKI